MMNMNMTDYQQQLIDSGEAVEFPVTIRYEQMCGGYKPRYETVKATLPDLGEGHEAIKMDGKQYHIANGRLYARLSYINRNVFQRGCGVIEDSFTLMEGDDKRQSVTDAYEEKYSDAVVVNNCIATPANVPLYARLYNNRLFITDKLDTELSYIGSQYVRSALPLMGVWYVPLVYAPKLRNVYEAYRRSGSKASREDATLFARGGDKPRRDVLLYDETLEIPFDNENVYSALMANAENAERRLENGVYLPAVEELHATNDVLDALYRLRLNCETFPVAGMRRLGDTIVTYEETRKKATIL